MNPLWLILLVGGGALYFSKLKNTGENLSLTLLNIDSVKITAGSLQLAVNIAVDNPTDNTINIKMPYLKAFFEGDEVGNSLPNGTRINILANSRTVINKVNLQIPFSNIPSLISNYMKHDTTKKTSIEFEVSTEVNNLPVTERKTFLI
jgi:hypothetical protein